MDLLEVSGLGLQRRRSRRGWWHRRVEVEPVFEDLDFRVGRRESLALVCVDRAGSLDLALALAGEGPVDGGAIVIAGVPLESHDPRRLRRIRRKVRFVFPDRCGQLPPDLTIRESFRVVQRGEPEVPGPDRLDRAMVACGLPGAILDLFPMELDAVERQAAALARCLLVEPDLLVICGWTEGMDAVQTMEAILRLRRVREEFPLSLLLLTDDLAVAAPLADRIGIIHRGRLVESGSTPDLLARPGHDYTQRLVACAA